MGPGELYEKRMIVQAIHDAIKEQWPYLKIVDKIRNQETLDDLRSLHGINFPVATDTIEVYYVLKPKKELGFPQEVDFWVATIHVIGEQIKLSIIRNKYCYENVLSSPLSLDELYTILATHLEDVRALLPLEWHSPQYPGEPSELELAADKQRAAASLKPTTLRIREWGN